MKIAKTASFSSHAPSHTVAVATPLLTTLATLLVGLAGCSPTYDDATFVGAWAQVDSEAQRLTIKADGEALSATMTLRGGAANQYDREYSATLRRDAVGGMLMESVDVFTTSSSDPTYRLALRVDEGRLLCTGCLVEGDTMTCDDAPLSKRSPNDPYLAPLRCKWRRVR